MRIQHRRKRRKTGPGAVGTLIGFLEFNNKFSRFLHSFFVKRGIHERVLLSCAQTFRGALLREEKRQGYVRLDLLFEKLDHALLAFVHSPPPDQSRRRMHGTPMIVNAPATAARAARARQRSAEPGQRRRTGRSPNCGCAATEEKLPGEPLSGERSIRFRSSVVPFPFQQLRKLWCSPPRA